MDDFLKGVHVNRRRTLQSFCGAVASTERSSLRGWRRTGLSRPPLPSCKFARKLPLRLRGRVQIKGRIHSSESFECHFNQPGTTFNPVLALQCQAKYAQRATTGRESLLELDLSQLYQVDLVDLVP